MFAMVFENLHRRTSFVIHGKCGLWDTVCAHCDVDIARTREFFKAQPTGTFFVLAHVYMNGALAKHELSDAIPKLWRYFPQKRRFGRVAGGAVSMSVALRTSDQASTYIS
jgi:hypothetical protein